VNNIITVAPIEILRMLDTNIVTIVPAGFGQPRFGDPNIQFIDANCSCPAQFIPCTWNDQIFLKITNNGEASDQCQLGAMITGHTPSGQFIPVGDPFSMNAGESKDVQISIHFNEDYWTQTEDIELIFVIGYWINETQIQVTDSISFNPQIYVPGMGCSDYTNQIDCVNAQCYWWSDGTCHDTAENGNGNGACEDYTTQASCAAAGCYWYAKYFWDAPSCHTAEQNMMMDYLPFIIAGVGGAIIIVALVTRGAPTPTPAPVPYYPPPRYPPPKYPYPPQAY